MLLSCLVCGVLALSSLLDVPVGLLSVLSLALPVEPAGAAGQVAASLVAQDAIAASSSRDCHFSRQSWYRTIKRGDGGALLKDWPQRIFVTSGGRFYVPDPSSERELLRLRRDPAVACFVALSAAVNNSVRLQKTGPVSQSLTNLYLAHVFGADAAIRMLDAVEAAPNALLAARFPNLDLALPQVGALYLRKIRMRQFMDLVAGAVGRVSQQAKAALKDKGGGNGVGQSAKSAAADIMPAPATFSQSRMGLGVGVLETGNGDSRADGRINPRLALTRMPLHLLSVSRAAMQDAWLTEVKADH